MMLRFLIFLASYRILIVSGQLLESSQPNILVLVVDRLSDQTDDVFSSSVAPSIRNIARDGIILKGSSLYSKSVPSRESFVSGKALFAQHHDLPPLSKKLERLGYETRGIGKWHQSFDQTDQAFQHYFDVWGADRGYDTPHRVMVMDEGIYSFSDSLNGVLDSTRSSSAVLTDVAITALKARESTEKPLFVFLSYYSSLLIAKEVDSERYKPCSSLTDTTDTIDYSECLTLIDLDQR